MSSVPEKPKLAPVIHERPKMPARTWSALRSHIIAERRKKQEEEGKLEEEKRLKREREHKKRQEANNLEETKEQISLLEEKLSNLKEEKHQLFLTLKKVLNEDDVRRRKESSELAVLYPQQHSSVFPMTGHVAQTSNAAAGGRYMHPAPQSRQSVYMKPSVHGLPPVPPAQPIKRQRTPSPSRPSMSQPYFNSSRAPTSIYGAPSSSYSIPSSYPYTSTQATPSGGRDLLREAVSHGIGSGARELLQSIGAREREILNNLGPRERDLLLGVSGRDLLAVGGGSVDRDRELMSQALLGGQPPSMISALNSKEEDAYARYLASFQQQLSSASKNSLSDLDRARLSSLPTPSYYAPGPASQPNNEPGASR